MSSIGTEHRIVRNTETNIFTISSRRPAGFEERDSIASHVRENKPQTFNPCCCDCDGRCSLMKWCRGIAVYGVLLYSAMLSTAASLLAINEDNLHTFYDKQFKPSSNFVQDFKLNYEGYRRTCEIQLGISCLMLIGYSMLLIATMKTTKQRWRELLCLGQPLATGISICIQLTLKLYFYFQQGIGTIANYFLLLDAYFLMCATGLFKNLKAEKLKVKDMDDLEFPEYPPDRVQNLPLIYLTGGKRNPVVMPREFLRRNSKDSTSLAGESTGTGHTSYPVSDPPPYSPTN